LNLKDLRRKKPPGGRPIFAEGLLLKEGFHFPQRGRSDSHGAGAMYAVDVTVAGAAHPEVLAVIGRAVRVGGRDGERCSNAPRSVVAVYGVGEVAHPYQPVAMVPGDIEETGADYFEGRQYAAVVQIMPPAKRGGGGGREKRGRPNAAVARTQRRQAERVVARGPRPAYAARSRNAVVDPVVAVVAYPEACALREGEAPTIIAEGGRPRSVDRTGNRRHAVYTSGASEYHHVEAGAGAGEAAHVRSGGAERTYDGAERSLSGRRYAKSCHSRCHRFFPHHILPPSGGDSRNSLYR
jgi:hypothetical protein